MEKRELYRVLRIYERAHRNYQALMTYTCLIPDPALTTSLPIPEHLVHANVIQGEQRLLPIMLHPRLLKSTYTYFAMLKHHTKADSIIR